MALHLKITGIIMILLALVHVGFPARFNWKEELRPLSLINRQMMQVHTFFIALAVCLMGLLCICNAEDLIHTKLGKAIFLAFSVFWGARLLTQFFIYSGELWKGKRFETIVHIVFSLLWTYFTVVFMAAYFS